MWPGVIKAAAVALSLAQGQGDPNARGGQDPNALLPANPEDEAIIQQLDFYVFLEFLRDMHLFIEVP